MYSILSYSTFCNSFYSYNVPPVIPYNSLCHQTTDDELTSVDLRLTTVDCFLETCQSGRMDTLGKRASEQSDQGFESLRFRRNKMG